MSQCLAKFGESGNKKTLDSSIEVCYITNMNSVVDTKSKLHCYANAITMLFAYSGISY